MTLLFSGYGTPARVVFLLSGFVFMAMHWCLLVPFIRSLLSGNRNGVSVFGMLAVFPVGLVLALIMAAGRIGGGLMGPAACGVLVLPLAATFYALALGLRGCLAPEKNARRFS